MKMLRITLEGKSYEVGVEVLDGAPSSVAPAPAYVASPVAAPTPAPIVAAPVAAPAPVVQAAPAPAPLAAGGHSVVSPMPGVVFKIRVAVGQQVAANEEVVLLEAMKMEAPIYSPVAGTVTAILVKETDSVNEGQVLIQLS
jgi:glutaconyl-CoA/methylmalonyl-CoA decarboxylase subunit gamma